jgi:hypothetical protein
VCNTPHLDNVDAIDPNKLSGDQRLESKYYQDPDSCDLSELMVLENIVTGRKDVVTLFWENKLGIDVEVCVLPSKCLPVVLMTLRMIIASFYSKDGKA